MYYLSIYLATGVLEERVDHLGTEETIRLRDD